MLAPRIFKFQATGLTEATSQCAVTRSWDENSGSAREMELQSAKAGPGYGIRPTFSLAECTHSGGQQKL